MPPRTSQKLPFTERPLALLSQSRATLIVPAGGRVTNSSHSSPMSTVSYSPKNPVIGPINGYDSPMSIDRTAANPSMTQNILPLSSGRVTEYSRDDLPEFIPDIVGDPLQFFLSRRSDLNLTSRVTGINSFQLTHGGLGDIYTGYLGETRVAAKRLRVHIMRSGKAQLGG